MIAFHTATLQAARAAERSWFDDGFENIYRGLLLLLLSFDFVLPAPSSQYPLYTRMSPYLHLCGLVLFTVLNFSHRPVIEWIKAKVSFPRVGYVAPPPSAVGPEQPVVRIQPAMVRLGEEEYFARQEKIGAVVYIFIVVLFILGLWHSDNHVFNGAIAIGWALLFAFVSHSTQPRGRSAWTAFCVCLLAGFFVVLFLLGTGHQPVIYFRC